MKTAKKLFSLLLVAVLLFSAVPFQAAATSTTYTVNFILKDIDTGNQIGPTTSVNPTEDGGLYKFTVPATPTDYDPAEYWTVNLTGAHQSTAAIQAGISEDPFKDDGAINVYGYFKKTHVHNYNDGVTTKEATCTAAGEITYTCQDTTCNSTKTSATNSLGHLYGEWETVTEANQEHAGQDKATCSRCGDIQYRTQNQLATTVIFCDNEGNANEQTRDWYQGQTITVNDIPSLNDLVGRKFDGWYTRPDGLGQKLITGNWNAGKDYYATTYYAHYRESQYAQGAKVTVYASIFSGSTLKNTVKLGELAFQNGDYILSTLMTNRQSYINNFFDYSGYSVADYEVADEAFYKNNLSTEKITDGTTVANGTTSVYIKIKAKNSAAASVQLFVHTKVNSSYALYDLTGFVAGDQITDTYIKNFLKDKTGKSYNLTGMYDQYNWDRLCNGFTSESNTRLEVPADGKLRIHVIAPSYTNTTTSSKPASNPATGDMIEVTAAVMLLAAAAVVTLTQLRKRKMI